MPGRNRWRKWQQSHRARVAEREERRCDNMGVRGRKAPATSKTVKRRNLKFLLLATSVVVKTAGAQEAMKQRSPSEGPSKICEPPRENLSREHRFWDQENRWLFAGVGAARTLDYFSTLNMRRRGRQEIFLTNDVVDHHAAFAAIEAAATGVSVGASYLFHRYGHHKLERWASFVHIGLATSGAVSNYCLKTAHPTTTP